jgi:hypothetical protein
MEVRPTGRLILVMRRSPRCCLPPATACSLSSKVDGSTTSSWCQASSDTSRGRDLIVTRVRMTSRYGDENHPHRLELYRRAVFATTLLEKAELPDALKAITR